MGQSGDRGQVGTVWSSSVLRAERSANVVGGGGLGGFRPAECVHCLCSYRNKPKCLLRSLKQQPCTYAAHREAGTCKSHSPHPYQSFISSPPSFPIAFPTASTHPLTSSIHLPTAVIHLPTTCTHSITESAQPPPKRHTCQSMSTDTVTSQDLSPRRLNSKRSG